MRLRAIASAAFLLMVAGCGTLNGPRTGTVSPPTDALSRWASYPANQVPRPILLFDNVVTPAAYSSREVKLAAFCGKFNPQFHPAAAVPKQAIASWVDGTKASYPAVSDTEALATMVHHARYPSDPGCATVAPIVLSTSRWAVAGFATDRGTAQMSAWIFSAAGDSDTFGYPALPPTAFWLGGPRDPSIGDAATVGGNGRVLTFSFPGGPPDGPCAEDYTGVIAESNQAVAVAVQSNPGRPEGGVVTCDLVGHIRAVTLQLASPLGGRVVVDASGYAVGVCPEAMRAGC